MHCEKQYMLCVDGQIITESIVIALNPEVNRIKYLMQTSQGYQPLTTVMPMCIIKELPSP